jgi:hypothetical protein
MAPDQALRVLWISKTVVLEIPIQSIRTSIRMAGGAALPLLMAKRRVIEELLAEPWAICSS